MAGETVRAWDMADHTGKALRRLGESESYISAFVEELAREHFAECAEAWDKGASAGVHATKASHVANPYRRTP